MKGLSYKWIVAFVVIFGLFMVILDTTIVNIAIPRLQTAFGASLSDVGWVATGYTLASGVGVPLTPFLSAYLGTKRFYLILLAGFTIGSCLCGLAWSLTALIAFRILQGIAGASMMPMSITLLWAEFPPNQRGMAMGTLGVPLMLAPALGPTLGGYIVTYIGWQMLFYINVPVGIIGWFLAVKFLRGTQPQRNLSFDVPGFLFSSLGMASLLYAFSSASDNGWGSVKVLTYLVIGVGSLIIFVVAELLTIQNGKQPLMDLRVFRTLSFSFANIAFTMTVFALYGGLFLVPLYLQNLRGLSAYDAGLVLLPQAIGSMISTVIGGRLADKIGVKAVVIPGLGILAAALWGFAHLSLNTPYSTFQIFLVLRGLGLGLAMQPMTIAALADIKPAMLSQASTVNSVIRAVTSSLAVGLVATIVSSRTTFHYVRLAEQVTPDSATGQALQQRAAYFMSQGMSQQNGMAAAISLMARQLQAQGYLLAMNDAFWLTLGVTFITALIVLLLIRSPRKKAAAASETKKPENMVSMNGKHAESKLPETVEEHVGFAH